MLSFHATKVFHTIEGGALCFKDSTLAERITKYRNFGINGTELDCFGTNAKMNEFQAAMGICNLRYIDGEIVKRKAAVNAYRKRLSGVEGIKLCEEQVGVESNYAYFPVIFDGYKCTRDEIFEILAAENITARKYFYPLTNDFACYKNEPYGGKEKTPVAANLAENVLCLPLFADLNESDVNRICDIILKLL